MLLVMIALPILEMLPYHTIHSISLPFYHHTNTEISKVSTVQMPFVTPTQSDRVVIINPYTVSQYCTASLYISLYSYFLPL